MNLSLIFLIVLLQLMKKTPIVLEPTLVLRTLLQKKKIPKNSEEGMEEY